ncbi:Vitamin D3 receptor B [Nymphon striatum]|nr:Vitamin D3 receptor B [Nymphon striatum]
MVLTRKLSGVWKMDTNNFSCNEENNWVQQFLTGFNLDTFLGQSEFLLKNSLDSPSQETTLQPSKNAPIQTENTVNPHEDSNFSESSGKASRNKTYLEELLGNSWTSNTNLDAKTSQINILDKSGLIQVANNTQERPHRPNDDSVHAAVPPSGTFQRNIWNPAGKNVSEYENDKITCKHIPDWMIRCRKKPFLPKTCGVCKKLARSSHFGGICCDSCKAFFRRAVKSNSHKKFICASFRHCSVIGDRRKFCQACRFRKCLAIGMKPMWVRTAESSE